MFEPQNEEAYWAAQHFLMEAKQTSQIPRNAQSSYTLKHKAEKAAVNGTYIPTGMLTIAALQMRLKVRKAGRGPEAVFNLKRID